jgi:hypothetical protein
LQPPQAPTDVTAVGGETSLHVSWSDSANNDAQLSYRVYYKAGAPFETVSEADGEKPAGVGSHSLSITGLTLDTTYYVRVAAVDENDNESALSSGNNVSATTVPVTDFLEHYKDEGGGESGGFCFIATAAYGTPLAAHVGLLREFRDRVLAPTALGRRFVSLYYAYSPALAHGILRHPWLQAPVRVLLFPLVAFAWFLLKLDVLGKLAALMGLWLLVRVVREGVRRRYARGGPELRPLADWAARDRKARGPGGSRFARFVCRRAAGAPLRPLPLSVAGEEREAC